MYTYVLDTAVSLTQFILFLQLVSIKATKNVFGCVCFLSALVPVWHDSTIAITQILNLLNINRSFNTYANTDHVSCDRLNRWTKVRVDIWQVSGVDAFWPFWRPTAIFVTSEECHRLTSQQVFFAAPSIGDFYRE